MGTNQANRDYDTFRLSDEELDHLSDEVETVEELDEQIDEANAELASADPTLELDMLDLNTLELHEIGEIRRALRLHDSGLDDVELDGEL